MRILTELIIKFFDIFDFVTISSAISQELKRVPRHLKSTFCTSSQAAKAIGEQVIIGLLLFSVNWGRMSFCKRSDRMF